MTNSINYSNNTSITNLSTKTIPEPVYPNSYLSTGKIEVEVPETPPRRLDLVFWIAMPAIYYLTSTIMYVKNQYVFGTITVDSTDNNYMYFNTFIIPMAAAYFDYLYMQDQYKMKMLQQSLSGSIHPFTEICMGFPIFYCEF
jgi:hypothetical protein